MDSRAFIKFNKGIMKMPIYWQLWLMLLTVANLFVPHRLRLEHIAGLRKRR